MPRRLPRALLVGLSAVSAACGAAAGDVPVSSSSPPPVLSAELNAVYRSNAGLLTGVADDGTPLTSGPAADPLITETHRFYDTLRTPLPTQAAVPVDYPDPFTGEATTTRVTAPMTFDDWKRVFEFPPPRESEDLQTYRDRVGITVYYNHNELGLGRELGCARFVDGTDDSGAPIMGIGCFVTNYGPGFRQGEASLQAAMAATEIRNTVCITYRPTMDAGYRVQFYVYGSTGKRQDWARLDTLGPRPHPAVCANCHGGAYDEGRHLVKNARFLPLDPAMVTFAVGDGVPLGLTRPGQEERIRVINQMAGETPLTSAQQGMLSRLYTGAMDVAGAPATGDDVPDAWATSAADHDFYRGVVKPYCGTCHMAGQQQLAATDLTSYAIFAAPAAFDAASTDSFVCNSFYMPNAQPTSLGFWDALGNPGVTIAATLFPTAADAYLARRHLDRSSCRGFAELSGCDRAPDPDALCGGAVSGGALCDRPSGRCVPTTSPIP